MKAARMLSVVHGSDLHYGPRHLQEADRCFAAAVDRAIAIAIGFDAAVIAGDATDHALDLHAPAVGRLIAQVRRLADHGPVLMLQGTWSHEPPGTLDVFRWLGGRYPVHVADRIGQVALVPDEGSTAGARWLASEGLRFQAVPPGALGLFTCVPSLNKAAMAACVGATAAGEALGGEVARLLAGYAPVHRAARARGVPTVVVSHGTVAGCISEHGVPMAGFDHEFTTGALFGAAAQAVMLGHMHRHQAWTRDGTDGHQCIAYSGSIGRFHHGEAGDKGFLAWSIGSHGATCRLEPMPARRTLDIVFDGRPDLDRLRELAASRPLDGVSVRVRWTVPEEDRHEVDRDAVRRLLADAADVALEGRIVPLQRTRAPGIAALGSIDAQVQAWARAIEVRAEPLLACLDIVDRMLPEDIVARVIDGPSSPKASSVTAQEGCACNPVA